MSNVKLFFKLLGKNINNIGEPQSYEAGGLEIFCPHCKHNKFYHQYKLLNTAGLTFFNLDFANRQAHTLTCARCGYIQWYGLKISRLVDE